MTSSILSNSELAATKGIVSLAKLYASLAKARAEFPEIPRNREAVVRMKNGGSYKYKYADLSDVFRATTPALSAYGLAVMQYVNGSDINTEIVHESGAARIFPWPIKPMPMRSLDDAQQFQSAVQVAKRYGLTAALGITTEETVEGNARVGGSGENANQKISIDANFETNDGIRHPRGAVFTEGMTPREKAQEAARAIIQQFKDVKTITGVEGRWSANEMFIEALRDRHPDLYSEVFDQFTMYCDDKSEAKRAD